jgi:nitrogen regulatory protein PII
MAAFKIHNNFSLVTAILPKATAKNILANSIAEYPSTGVLMHSRGTLQKERWYKKLKPAVSPEQTVIELLVKDNHVDPLMNSITIAGRFHKAGSGAVYSINCDKTAFLCNPSGGLRIINQSDKERINFKSNMVGIFCISQHGKSESIAQAAMAEGAPGPTVVFGQGRGIRERLGLLRIAISPEKDLIRVVVDDYDAEAVFEAMVKEGKLDTPGMGFIYSMPIDKSFISFAFVDAGSAELASSHQIIKAIDDLQGGAGWRTHNIIEGNNKKSRKMLTGLSRVTCVTERGKGDKMIEDAINIGAPGASISYGTMLGAEEKLTGTDISLTKEMEIIEMTVSPKIEDEIITAMADSALADGNENVFFYTKPVPKALTYLG